MTGPDTRLNAMKLTLIKAIRERTRSFERAETLRRTKLNNDQFTKILREEIEQIRLERLIFVCFNLNIKVEMVTS